MSTGGEPDHLHPVRTRDGAGHQYFFYDKHHGRGGPEAAQWATDLSEAEEFSIFDRSDALDLSDHHGNLFGLRLAGGVPQQVLKLGTLGEFVAKFPLAHPGQPWHGFPFSPVRPIGPLHPPDRTVPGDVLRTMEAKRLLSKAQRRRLQGGKDP